MRRVYESRPKHLVIRADGDSQVGVGHLMRCLALAQAWHDVGGEVTFVTTCTNDLLLDRIRAEGFTILSTSRVYPDIHDWEHTQSALLSSADSWLVLDGYNFDDYYQRMVKATGNPLLVIDDMATLSDYSADIVLNQNVFANRLKYTRSRDTRLLLGPRYALLRREFGARIGGERAVSDSARKVLVTLGGADAPNCTLRILHALSELQAEGLQVKAVVGMNNSHSGMLRKDIEKYSMPLTVVFNPADIAELMLWADVAVSAAGTTALELASLGVPTAVVAIAENQRATADEMGRAGSAYKLGFHQEIDDSVLAERLRDFLSDSARLNEMGKRAQSMVDGEGAARVVMQMAGSPLRLREARGSDARLLWEWSNAPDVRYWSFSQSTIRWEDHVSWFAEKLSDARCHFLIAFDSQDRPVGQARVDVSQDKAIIGVSVQSGLRGQGYGTELIRSTSARVFRKTPVTTITAYVKGRNKASIQAFAGAGYKVAGETHVGDNEALEMVLEKGAKS